MRERTRSAAQTPTEPPSNQSFVVTGAGQIPAASRSTRLSSPPAAPGHADRHVAPQTKIKKGPGGKLDKGIAKFSFASTEARLDLQVQARRRKTAGCSSPKRYKHLKPGRHTFRVWATDAAGNKDPTPAKRSFRVPKNSRSMRPQA